MTDDTLRVLRSIKILSNLDHDSLELLYSHMHEEFYRKGESLFQEGDAGDTMYVVIKGVVSIRVSAADGEAIEIAEIPEGNFLGEMSIFDNAPRSATCTPKTDCTVLSLKSEAFYSFIEKNPEAGNSIMHPMLKTITQ
ncbi:MAG: cyclic nucleotide-binding domain-containing protein, partial [Spirochaetales bacterium]|nr:cyclic nucleotide-binding domain-containing protein [Spirochaetales bacterium]